MKEMIAYCGITCTECPAFVATQKDGQDERIRVSEMWSKEFNVELKPEDINCDGCLADSSRLFSHCHVCEIRKCGQEKEVINCAYCDDYGCKKLTAFLDMVPEAKGTLEEIRSNL